MKLFRNTRIFQITRNTTTPHRLFHYNPIRWNQVVPSTTTEVSPSNTPVSSLNLLEQDELVVVRQMEWAQVLVGFEQANKYEIQTTTGEIVGYIAEETNITRTILRNITSNHRSFTATIFDANQQPLFVIKRPFYFINSSMTIEKKNSDGSSELMGHIDQVWHLLKRRYEMKNEKQEVLFQVDGKFLTWDFELINQNGEVVGTVNKNFLGFMREIFTDRNAYAIRLGPAALLRLYGSEQQQQQQIPTSTSDNTTPPNSVTNTTSTVANTNSMEIPPIRLQPLTLQEKAILLASAIAIDFDYFSHTSRGPGLFGFLPIPMPMPMPTPVDAVPPVDPTQPASSADATQTASSVPPNDFGSTPNASQEQDWRKDFFAQDEKPADEITDSAPVDDSSGDGEEGIFGKIAEFFSDD